MSRNDRIQDPTDEDLDALAGTVARWATRRVLRAIRSGLGYLLIGLATIGALFWFVAPIAYSISFVEQCCPGFRDWWSGLHWLLSLLVLAVVSVLPNMQAETASKFDEMLGDGSS